MATIKVGDTIPSGKFQYIPYAADQESATACGFPVPLSTDEWKGKKVVLFGVPGAFTPTCQADHLPPYIKNAAEFEKKGVDVVAVVSSNDPFVISAWGKVNSAKDKVLTLSDATLTWLKAAGLTLDLTDKGMGVRSNRFALIIDDLKVQYIGVETAPGVSVSGADAVLAKL